MTENQEVPGRRRRSGEEIRRLVLEFEASGLRQNEFCRNHGLALSTLQRQLKRRRSDKSEVKQVGSICRGGVGQQGSGAEIAGRALRFGGGARRADGGSRCGADFDARNVASDR